MEMKKNLSTQQQRLEPSSLQGPHCEDSRAHWLHAPNTPPDHPTLHRGGGPLAPNHICPGFASTPPLGRMVGGAHLAIDCALSPPLWLVSCLLPPCGVEVGCWI